MILFNTVCLSVCLLPATCTTDGSDAYSVSHSGCTDLSCKSYIFMR